MIYRPDVIFGKDKALVREYPPPKAHYKRPSRAAVERCRNYEAEYGLSEKVTLLITELDSRQRLHEFDSNAVPAGRLLLGVIAKAILIP